MIDVCSRRAAFFALLITMLAAPVTANAATTASDSATGPMATIARFVAAMDGNDIKSADATFAPGDAAITDDFAPFHWSGPHVVMAWVGDFAKSMALSQVTEPNIVVTPSTKTLVEGTHAYAPLPATFTYKIAGKPMKQSGMLVFSLERTGDAWQIVAMSWSQTQ